VHFKQHQFDLKGGAWNIKHSSRCCALH